MERGAIDDNHCSFQKFDVRNYYSILAAPMKPMFRAEIRQNNIKIVLGLVVRKSVFAVGDMVRLNLAYSLTV